jgi:aminopeptidase-like protein
MTAGGIDAAALPSREALGKELHALLTGLFPLHRSITGNGVRQTFAVMREVAPLEVGPSSTTGLCRVSGTSATPTSPTRPETG